MENLPSPGVAHSQAGCAGLGQMSPKRGGNAALSIWVGLMELALSSAHWLPLCGTSGKLSSFWCRRKTVMGMMSSL